MYETEAFEKWFSLGSGRREMIHMEIENIKNFYLKSSPSPQNKSAFIFSPFKDSSWQIIFLLPYFDSIPKPPNTSPSLFVRHPARNLTLLHMGENDSGWIDFFCHQFRLTILFPSITDGRKASNSVFLARSENIFNVCPIFSSSKNGTLQCGKLSEREGKVDVELEFTETVNQSMAGSQQTQKRVRRTLLD